MPMHDYECEDCGRIVEILTGKEQPPKSCVECGSPKIIKVPPGGGTMINMNGKQYLKKGWN